MSDVIIFVVNVVAAASVAEDGEKEFGRDGCVCGASQLSFVPRPLARWPDRRRLIVLSPLPILTVDMDADEAAAPVRPLSTDYRCLPYAGW